MKKADLGQLGEKLAEQYLKDKGLTILGRRFRHARGELDLIARQGQTIVFIEVKTRTSASFGKGEEAVTPIKQERMRATAESFVHEHPKLAKFATRFDVIAIDVDQASGAWQVEHFENALNEEAGDAL